jgi:dTDP-4-dehydrorhamnose reductase
VNAPAATGQRVLITGAGGQLGGYLRAALEAAGATVTGTGSSAKPGVDAIADITNADAVQEVFEQARPELVIHAAAWTDVDGCELDPARAESVNALGSRNVAEYARACSAHLVAVSTDFVFDGQDGAPYAEDASTNPLSVYGRTKLAGEEAVLTADPSFAVARTAWVYGGAGKHFPRTVLTILRDRGRMEVIADEAGSPTFAGDLAAALAGLAASRGSGIFHLVNAGRATRFELAREVATVAGYEPSVVAPVSAQEFLSRYPLPAKRPADSTLANTRAASLGMTLPPWESAVAAYVPRLAAELANDRTFTEKRA